jgi:predicted transcriptional regulator
MNEKYIVPNLKHVFLLIGPPEIGKMRIVGRAARLLERMGIAVSTHYDITEEIILEETSDEVVLLTSNEPQIEQVVQKAFPLRTLKSLFSEARVQVFHLREEKYKKNNDPWVYCTKEPFPTWWEGRAQFIVDSIVRDNAKYAKLIA